MDQIFTIGHSNRQWNDFVSILQTNQIHLVVDVRRYPGSKKYPQFNKDEMIKALKKENIVYLHVERLGGRRRNITSEKHTDINNGWKNMSFRAYADYMATTPFEEGINEILSLIAKYDNLAIMCTEVVPWRCHRRMIADYLTLLHGVCVVNIIDSTHRSTHKVTSFAHLSSSYFVTYPEI
jgi:uncharacterized protein (DUF488 family)